MGLLNLNQVYDTLLVSLISLLDLNQVARIVYDTLLVSLISLLEKCSELKDL